MGSNGPLPHTCMSFTPLTPFITHLRTYNFHDGGGGGGGGGQFHTTTKGPPCIMCRCHTQSRNHYTTVKNLSSRGKIRLPVAP